MVWRVGRRKKFKETFAEPFRSDLPRGFSSSTAFVCNVGQVSPRSVVTTRTLLVFWKVASVPVCETRVV